jgi:hypothetical protein
MPNAIAMTTAAKLTRDLPMDNSLNGVLLNRI